MAGNNKQRKSYSFSFMFVFNILKSSKKKSKGSGQYQYSDAGCDTCRRVWPSDEDKGRWGVAEPGIDKKAECFIAHHKKRVWDHDST